MTKEITIDDVKIEVIKKKIKNLYISVQPPNGRVRITAPWRMSDAAIRAFAVSKLSWIKKHQAKFQKQEMQSQKEYISGERHYYRGECYLLNVVYTNKKQKAEIKNNQIDLYVREGSTREQRERVMTEWYRNELKKQIPYLIEKWEKTIGVKVNFWGIKQMKTRWGSCNPKHKRIWINLELAKKKPECLEYIVVHELIHLLVRYHNKRFYAYLDQFMPGWKEIKRELKNQ